MAWVEKRAGRPVPVEHKDDSPFYAAGSVHDVPESYANKYVVSRKVAEFVAEKPKAFKAEPAPEPAKPEYTKPDPVKK